MILVLFRERYPELKLPLLWLYWIYLLKRKEERYGT